MMFNDDLRERVNKMEREIELLKSMQIDVARITLSVGSLSEKLDERFNALDKKIDDRYIALDKKIDDKFNGLDKRLSRFEVGVITFVAIVLGGAFSVLVFPALKMMYFS